MEYADGNPVIFWNADKFQNIKIVFFRFSRDLNIDLFCDKMCVCVCVCMYMLEGSPAGRGRLRWDFENYSSVLGDL